MSAIDEAVGELRSIFRSVRDKHEAHARIAPAMEAISHDPRFVTELLERHLRKPGSLDRQHYPTVTIEVDLNPWFGVMANCWIPLPGGRTNLSTKAIHHHGELLLTTATLFGPGYEHWTFTTPEALDPERKLYRMKLIEAAPHPQHHVAFVGEYIPHTPFYPPELSVTLALFSDRRPTTWRDHVKRLPGIRGREAQLRKLVSRIGLGRALAVKVIESHDFYPTPDGFAVMKDRKEFELGPNEDYLPSLFHILQRTGNEQLADVIEAKLRAGEASQNRPLVQSLLQKLKAGEPIEPRLSPRHTDRPYANFTREDIERALAHANAA